MIQMKHLVISMMLILMPATAILQARSGAAHINDPWEIGTDISAATLLQKTLNASIEAHRKGDFVSSALNLQRIKTSVERHPQREEVGRALLSVRELILSAPIGTSDSVKLLRTLPQDSEVGNAVRNYSDETLANVTRLGWELSILELVVEAKPAGYRESVRDTLIASAMDRTLNAVDRSNALVSIARGFQSGDLDQATLDKLSEGLSGESHNFRRLRLGVLGQVGSDQTLQFVEQLRDDARFQAERENCEFAVTKLQYTLAPDVKRKREILDATLRSDRLSLLTSSWALRCMLDAGHIELLPTLQEIRKRFKERYPGLERQLLECERGLEQIRDRKQDSSKPTEPPESKEGGESI